VDFQDQYKSGIIEAGLLAQKLLGVGMEKTNPQNILRKAIVDFYKTYVICPSCIFSVYP